MIPTEPIGSIPRPAWLIQAIAASDSEDPTLDPLGFRIPFKAGHARRMLRLTNGPFRYRRHADE